MTGPGLRAAMEASPRDVRNLHHDEVLALLLEKMKALETGQDMLFQAVEGNQAKLVAYLGSLRQLEPRPNQFSWASDTMPVADSMPKASLKEEIFFDEAQLDPHSGNVDSKTVASGGRYTSKVATTKSDEFKHPLSHQETMAERDLTEVVNFVNRPRTPHEERSGLPTRQQLEKTLDIVAGLTITLNAIVLAALLDSSDSEGGVWFAIKLVFTVIFWSELIVRMKLSGFRNQYCGKGAFGNIFDTFLILVDTLDIVLSLFIMTIPGGKSILILRTVRLLRLARLFKIFQAPVFKDLVAMVHALMAGMPTLLWSVVFFVCFLYVVALIFRAGFGPPPTEHEQDPTSRAYYFQTVPRALLTTFRCSFGDCSTKGGTPIFEFATTEGDSSGTWLGMALSCFIFISSVGLFNIISAVFLERVMAYASDLAVQKQQKRLIDTRLWHRNIAKFIDIMVQLHEQDGRNMRGEEPLKFDATSSQGTIYMALKSETLETLKARTIPKQIVDVALQETLQALQEGKQNEIAKVLSALDIEPQDCVNLADTLDQDNSGDIQVTELIMGISRMRGPARRSDIVTVDLMMRSMQSRIDELWLHLKRKHSRSSSQQ